jgi:hypothetical protein
MPLPSVPASQFFCQQLGHKTGRLFYGAGISSFGRDEIKP